MILRHAGWQSELVPRMTLTEADVVGLADALVAFPAEVQACFGRTEHRRLGHADLAGLMRLHFSRSLHLS